MPFDVVEVLKGFGSVMFIWLPIMMFAMIIYLLWRTLQVMPRVKTTQVKQSSISNVTWDEVAGLDEAKAEMREVVDFLRHPQRFERLGARVPKGILLHGPPGTGKTLLAKAVAHESRASFYSQSASAFVEMFAGLGAARIRKLFEQARNDAPAIVFIDELDAVGMKRTGGGGGDREHDQTLNQLLVELDGFNKSEGQVIVMGASNRLDNLDPALLRPGRFDRQILVSPPDLAGREQILKVHTRGKPLSPDIDLHVVARQTAGLTGADLANIANEAAIFAGREDRNDITHANFEAAMERVVAGLQQKRVVTEKEKRILAYHEAGHAVMAYLLGDPVQKATIVSRGEALGYTFHLPEEERYLHTREELIDWMKIGLAGRAAEQVVFGRVTNGAASDLEKVTIIARAMVFEYGMSEGVVSRTMRADNYALSEETKQLRDTEQARLTDGAYDEAIRLLEKHRTGLDLVAGALLERETLNRDDLANLLANIAQESRSSETVGTIRVLPQPEHG